MTLADTLKQAAADRKAAGPVYRTAEQMTVAEHVAADRAAAAGEPAPKFETRESIERRAAELREAGFEHEAAEVERQLPSDDDYSDPAAVFERDRAAGR